MIFYLVRHGQTDWNNERRFQGQTDIPMNEAGIRQISELAQRLANSGIRFDRLIASPLIRAKRTAEIIAETTGSGGGIVFDADFMERSCGALEGQLWTPDLDYSDPAYGMETDQELLDRAERALNKYAFAKDEKVMIVSHGAMLYAVKAVLSDHRLDLDDKTAPVIQGNVLCCVKEEGKEAVFFNLFDPGPEKSTTMGKGSEGMCGLEKNTVRAVIFDLDGTLTDTEKYFQQAWAEAMARSGFEPDREKTLALRSLGLPFVNEQLVAWFGPKCRPEEIRALSHSIFNSIAKEQGVELRPGAEKLLAWLKEKGVVIALATAGTTERAEKQLTAAGVRDYFDKVISSNMVALGKPAPDTYLHACEVLGVRPGEAIAVEDSPNGVKSAHAAGCRVVMFPDQSEPDEEIGPMLYACVRSLDEIIKLVADRS